MKLSFKENNGEYNQLCNIEFKGPNDTEWATLQAVELKEAASTYNISINTKNNYRYRIRVVDLNGKEYITNEVMAVNDAVSFGDPIEVEGGGTKYLGGNQLVNGSFDLGLYGWTNSTNAPMTAPYYQAVPIGGYNGTSYLQCYGNAAQAKHEQSIRTVFTFEDGDYVYVTAAGCNNGEGAASNQKIAVSYSKTNFGMADEVITMTETTKWYKQTGIAKITDSAIYLGIVLNHLNGTAQFDDFMVAKLFDTAEEALADALEWEKKRGEAFKAWNTQYEFLPSESNHASEESCVLFGANLVFLDDAERSLVVLAYCINLMSVQSAVKIQPSVVINITYRDSIGIILIAQQRQCSCGCRFQNSNTLFV